MTGLVDNQFHCRRFDLTMPMMIFGGLLIAATAVCAIDSSPAQMSAVDLDEVKVAADQPFGSHEMQDPVAMSCKKLDRPDGKKLCQTGSLH